MFDEPNLVSAAGLVPIMELAEQTGLSWLIGKQVDLPSTRVKSGAVNPVGKLTTIIGGMICGADSIDDVDVLRAGGTPRVFDEIASQPRGVGGEIQLTDGIAGLLKHEKAYAYRYDGKRYDCGSKEGFLQANVELALADRELGADFRAYLQSLSL